MKKIGIISYFNYYNYGSMLQGYALQKYISSMSNDVDCEIINYRNQATGKASKWELFKIRLKRITYYITHLKEIRIKAKYTAKMSVRNVEFDIFLRDYTHVTKTFYRTKQQLIDNPPVYDLYVTGSDQTWSPNVSGGYQTTPMFLDFAIEGSRKAAYAPCVGVNSFTDEQKEYLKNKLAESSLISCRAVKGAKLLSDITGSDVPAVVDPTLLLTAVQWRELMKPTTIKRPYIFCYFIGDRQYYRDFANHLSQQTGLPIYYIPVNWKEYTEDDNRIWDAGPRDFVGLIAGAEYVCTDSFHGVAFSSNLNKNFFAFVKHAGNANAGDNSRLFDYLDRIGLANRLLTTYDGNDIDITPIDYSFANKKLEEERAKSFSYLEKLIAL